MVLAIAGGADLLRKTQQTFFRKRESEINRVRSIIIIWPGTCTSTCMWLSGMHQYSYLQLMSSIVNRDWTQLVRVCNLDNWREVLAALVTYASPDEFSALCGERRVNVHSFIVR